MVKAQVKGFSTMQAEWHPSHDGTWSSTVPGSSASAASKSPSPSLKRPRSPSASISMSHQVPLPAIPQLSGDLILDVFTHKSLRYPDIPIDADSEHGSTERLEILGKELLSTAVTLTLFRIRPMISADEMLTRREQYLSNEALNEWVTAYKLREKVRCDKESIASLTLDEETQQLFCSYVGAVYVQQGMSAVQNWIGALVDPQSASVPSTGPDADNMAVKRLRNDQMGASPPPFSGGFINVPPPPMTAPPPLPSNPLAPAQPQSAFLPLFNQTANQRRMTVDYPAQFTGPPHAGMWSVQCIVDGIPKGTGAGASKQLAKEEAAKQAYYAMGWAPHT